MRSDVMATRASPPLHPVKWRLIRVIFSLKTYQSRKLDCWDQTLSFHEKHSLHCLPRIFERSLTEWCLLFPSQGKIFSHHYWHRSTVDVWRCQCKSGDKIGEWSFLVLTHSLLNGPANCHAFWIFVVFITSPSPHSQCVLQMTYFFSPHII